jgi:hypothetical protein
MNRPAAGADRSPNPKTKVGCNLEAAGPSGDIRHDRGAVAAHAQVAPIVPARAST